LIIVIFSFMTERSLRMRRLLSLMRRLLSLMRRLLSLMRGLLSHCATQKISARGFPAVLLRFVCVVYFGRFYFTSSTSIVITFFSLYPVRTTAPRMQRPVAENAAIR
jgi:hypothetical protein